MVSTSYCHCVLSSVGILSLFVLNVLGLTCNLPETVHNGQLVYGPDYDYEDYLASDPTKSNPGDVITIVCDYGFAPSGGGSGGDSTCQDTGSWDPPIPSCSPKGDNLTTASPEDCPTPLIADGSVSRSGTTLPSGKLVPSGTFVDVSCDTGFRLLDGDDVLTCQVDGKWQGRIPHCVADIVTTGNTKCQVPDIPASRIKYLHNTVNGGDELDPGKEISVVCNPGYAREGKKYLRCLNNGSWSQTIPECRSSFLTVAPPTSCKLPVIPNGAYFIAKTSYDYGGSDYGGGDYGGGAYGDAYNTYDSVPTPHTQSKSQASDIRELALGGSIEVQCDSGYEIEGSKHVNCDFDGTLSNVPLCLSESGPGTDNKCYVPQIINGRIKLLHDVIDPATPVDINETITISCDEAMDREGEKFLTCLANGTWNHLPPKCKAKSIDPFTPCSLPEISNGRYNIPTSSPDSAGGSTNTGYDYEYSDYSDDGGQTGGSTIAPTQPQTLFRGLNMTVICNSGYKLNGSSTVTCYENVTLSAIPTCENVHCTVQTIRNGSLKLGNTVAPSKVDFNDTLAASCDEGFNLIGADRLTCGEKQEFDEDFPRCLNGTAFCTIPTIENGRPSLLRPGLNLASLDTVKIVCNRGYLVDTTSNVIKCGVNGDWLPKVPKCLIARCKIITVIPDGRVLFNGSLAPSTIQYGDNITVSCNAGFRLVGSQDSVQCREDGTLSAKLPSCVPENKGSCRVSIMKDDHTNIDTNLNFVHSGWSVKMSCVQGFIPNIEGDELNCDEGTWRQRMPVCVKDNKCTLPEIKHGKITFGKNRRDRDNSILVNDTAYVECDFGYFRKGEEKIVCVAVEKYKDPLPSCTVEATSHFCIAPNVGYGELIGTENGNVITFGGYVPPNTRIVVKCQASDEVGKVHREAECLKNGSWSQKLYGCVKAPESVSVANTEHQLGTAEHTLYIAIGTVVAALVIIAVIIAVVLHRRRKQQMAEVGPVMYNNVDNMVYLTSAEARKITGSNGHSNLGMNMDDGYMRPQNVRTRPSDDVVMRRSSHVRDSVAADYENDRPASVITFKPAYASKRVRDAIDKDNEV